jgi:hypothetical protein
MTPDQLATLGKVFITHLENEINALPEGDRKAAAFHHVNRAHHHLTKLASMAIDGGTITPNSVGGDKPPV